MTNIFEKLADFIGFLICFVIFMVFIEEIIDCYMEALYQLDREKEEYND